MEHDWLDAILRRREDEWYSAIRRKSYVAVQGSRASNIHSMMALEGILYSKKSELFCLTHSIYTDIRLGLIETWSYKQMNDVLYEK